MVYLGFSCNSWAGKVDEKGRKVLDVAEFLLWRLKYFMWLREGGGGVKWEKNWCDGKDGKLSE